jgi:hypothetical protein
LQISIIFIFLGLLLKTSQSIIHIVEHSSVEVDFAHILGTQREHLVQIGVFGVDDGLLLADWLDDIADVIIGSVSSLFVIFKHLRASALNAWVSFQLAE